MSAVEPGPFQAWFEKYRPEVIISKGSFVLPALQAMGLRVPKDVAFVDVPLVYVSTKLMTDIHPSSISLEPPMRLTLLVWFVAVAMLASGAVLYRWGEETHPRLNPAL